jgi:hypothetical protein
MLRGRSGDEMSSIGFPNCNLEVHNIFMRSGPFILDWTFFYERLIASSHREDCAYAFC